MCHTTTLESDKYFFKGIRRLVGAATAVLSLVGAKVLWVGVMVPLVGATVLWVGVMVPLVGPKALAGNVLREEGATRSKEDDGTGSRDP